MPDNQSLLNKYICYKSNLGFNCRTDSTVSFIEFKNISLGLSVKHDYNELWINCISNNVYRFRKEYSLFNDFKRDIPYPEYFKDQINIGCGNHANYTYPYLRFTLDINIFQDIKGYEKLDTILEYFDNKLDEVFAYYEQLELLDNNFRNYFYSKKRSANSDENISIEGPFTNGSYAIDYLDAVRILIWPNLYIVDRGFFVMDFICIPDNPRYILRNQYKALNRLVADFPHSEYLYGDITIESDLTYTSCLRFSLQNSIISDFSGFIKLDTILQYIKNHTHDVMSFYKEIEDNMIGDDATGHPAKEMFQFFEKMLEQK